MLYRMLSVLETERLQPVNRVLRQCLYPHISQKYSRVCSCLVQVLKDEYRLMGYLAAMRVCLHVNCILVQSFCVELSIMLSIMYRKLMQSMVLNKFLTLRKKMKLVGQKSLASMKIFNFQSITNIYYFTI